MKTLCVTGHRPDSLPWGNDEKNKIYKQFRAELERNILFCIENGYDHFIAGGALGIDTIFALEIIRLKERGKRIFLEIAVPCGGQEKSWTDAEKERYYKILKAADEVNLLSVRYYPFCMHARNEYMVGKSDGVLCCWTGKRSGGTFNTIKLAERLKKQLLLIDLRENAKNGGNSMLLFKDKIT